MNGEMVNNLWRDIRKDVANALQLVAGLTLGILLALGLRSGSARLLIGGIGLGFYILTLFLSPAMTLLLWLPVAPFSRYFYLDLRLGKGIPDLGFTRFIAGFVLLALIVQMVEKRKKLVAPGWTEVFMALFSLSIGVSAVISVQGFLQSIQSIFDAYYVPFLLFFLGKQFISTPAWRRRLVVILHLIVVVLAILAWREYFTHEALFIDYHTVSEYTRHIRRIISLLGDPAYTAMALSIILPWTLRETYMSESALARIVHVVLILINLATLVILANRAGWLAALVVLLIMASFEKRWRWPLLLSLAASAAVLWMLRDSISQSYLIKERLTAQAPIVYRTHAWQVAIILWKRSPLIGIGYYSFPWIGLREGFFPRLKVFYIPSTENAFLDVLTSAGALGLALFLGVFAGMIRDLRQIYVKMTEDSERTVAYALIASMAAYAITGFFTNLTPAFFIQRLFFFLAGAIIGSLQPILSSRRV